MAKSLRLEPHVSKLVEEEKKEVKRLAGVEVSVAALVNALVDEAIIERRQKRGEQPRKVRT